MIVQLQRLIVYSTKPDALYRPRAENTQQIFFLHVIDDNFYSAEEEEMKYHPGERY